MHLYSLILSQPKLGNLENWQYVLDTLDVVTWRPYLECEVWDDDMELGYYFQTRWLIRKTPHIIER